MSLANVNVIRYGQLTALITSFIQNPPKKGCLGIIGAPGTGKTAGVEGICKLLNEKLSYLALPLYTPGDILGAAWEKDGKTVFLPADVLDEDAVIFLDELPNADRSMQNIANRILLDHELNGRHFTKAMIFAGNPTACSEMADPLPNILVNKSVLFEVDYRAEDFLAYATGPMRPNLHPLVPAFIAETKEAYLQVKDWTPLKHGGVPTPEVGSPFPSPRSYEALSGMLYRIDGGLDLTAFDAAYATLGAVAGKAFGDYAVCFVYLPSIRKILNGENEQFPEKALMGGVALLPLQMMVMFGCLGAASDKEEFQNATKWIFKQVEAGILTKDLVRAYASYCRHGAHKEYYREVLQKYAKTAYTDPKQLVAFLKDIMESTAEVANF